MTDERITDISGDKKPIHQAAKNDSIASLLTNLLAKDAIPNPEVAAAAREFLIDPGNTSNIFHPQALEAWANCLPPVSPEERVRVGEIFNEMIGTVTPRPLRLRPTTE